MRMLLSSRRSTFPSLCLLALLAGCASKNPLMEEPATASTPAAKPAAPASSTAAAPAAAPAPVAAATAPVKPAEPAPPKPAATAAVTPPAAAPAPVAAAPAPAKPAETATATPAAPAAAPAATAAAPVKPAEAATTKTASGVQTIEQRSLFGIFSPYRIDIQQGNFVSREMVAQIKPGMTPDQVRFALGTPLLTDIFHADRWDYVFRLKKGNGEIITSKVVLRFKDNRLSSIDGADLPTEKDYLSLIAGTAPQEAAKPAAPEAKPAAAPAAAVSGPSLDPTATPAPPREVR